MNMSTQGQVELEERRAGKILFDLIDTRARTIAREEIASMAGLVLRRLQEIGTPDKPVWGHEDYKKGLSAIFGELLRDYTQTSDEPGGDDT